MLETISNIEFWNSRTGNYSSKKIHRELKQLETLLNHEDYYKKKYEELKKEIREIEKVRGFRFDIPKSWEIKEEN